MGERMTAGKLLGRSVVIRELMPQDLKFDIDQLSEEAVNAKRHLKLSGACASDGCARRVRRLMLLSIGANLRGSMRPQTTRS